MYKIERKRGGNQYYWYYWLLSSFIFLILFGEHSGHQLADSLKEHALKTYLKKKPPVILRLLFAQSVEAVESHRLYLCRGVRPPSDECPAYDAKQSNGTVPVILELWRIRSAPSLPSLPGPLWSGVVVPDRSLSIGQIGLNYVLMLNRTAWNRTVWHWNCL